MRLLSTTVICLFMGACSQASASVVTLGQSTQNLGLTGLGPNSSGDGVSRVTWGNCTFDGTNTSCTLSGPFTGLGSSGTWVFLLTYPGNGQSPLTAITQPGSDLFTLSLSAGSLTFTFNVTNGPSVSFNTGGSIFYVQGSTSCTGTVTVCSVGQVGQTAGATISGPVTGTLDPTPVIQTAISAGSYGGFASIAPGTWIEIYGKLLATTTKTWGQSDFQGNNAPKALGGTTVTIGGQSAFVDYVSPTQVNVQVPSALPTGSQPLVVTTIGGASLPFAANVNTNEPGLLAPAQFKVNGTQYAVALFSDGFYVLPPNFASGVASRRAVPGDTIILYGIGFGTVTPDNPAGVIAQGQTELTNKFNVSLGGADAHVAYAGLTPGFVGLYQFNVVVPNIPASDTTPLTFTLNGTSGTQTLALYIGN